MGIISAIFMMPFAFAEQYPPNTQINFIMELTNSAGLPITSATCEGKIFNSSLQLLDTLPLSYDSNTGIYYSQFTTPNSDGQYIQKGECNTTNGKTTISRKELTVSSFANLDAKFQSINDTIKSVNSTVMTKLYAMQDEISSVNNTVITESLNLNNSINYWGSSNTNITNYWGGIVNTNVNNWGTQIYNFMLNMTVGNVSVYALVDYDEIALYVVSYLRGLEVMGLFK